MLDCTDRWKTKLANLQAFIESNGRLPVLSKRASKEERNLATWMARQRMAYYSPNQMEAKRIVLLEGLPLWHWGKDDGWMRKYNRLKDFTNLNMHMPRNSKTAGDDEKALAIWCNTQKQAKKGKGTATLSDNRIQLLEQIVGWYWGHPEEVHLIHHAKEQQ